VSLYLDLQMQLLINSTNFRHYEGENHTSVRELYAETSWFSFSPFRTSTFSLTTYSRYCIGIESKEPFAVFLRIKNVDVLRVLCFSVAIFLYFLSPSIAQNILFHYMTGSLIGVVGSLVVILFLLSKFIPKRSGAVTFLVGGSGILLYALQFFYEHIIHVLSEHRNLVIGYICVTVLISLCVVYRWGPVSDHRTLKLIQWFLQTIALLLLYFSSQFKEITIATMVLIVCYSNSPTIISNTVSKLWRKYNPPKVKMLTQEEYVRQGQRETQAALEDLRRYCMSPGCNAWKTFRKLESPSR